MEAVDEPKGLLYYPKLPAYFVDKPDYLLRGGFVRRKRKRLRQKSPKKLPRF